MRPQAHTATLGYFFPGASFVWENLLIEHAAADKTSHAHAPGATVTITATGTDLDGKTAVVLGPADGADGATGAETSDATGAARGEMLHVRVIAKTEDGTPHLDTRDEHSLPASQLTTTAYDHLINGVVQPPAGAPPDAAPADADVIVTASAERTKVVAALARELHLPFVEFNMLLVRGDIDGSTYPLTACWLSLGGYDSIFSWRQVRVGSAPDEHVRDDLKLTLSKQMARKNYFLKAHRMEHCRDNETRRRTDFLHRAFSQLDPPTDANGAGAELALPRRQLLPRPQGGGGVARWRRRRAAAQSRRLRSRARAGGP